VDHKGGGKFCFKGMWMGEWPILQEVWQDVLNYEKWLWGVWLTLAGLFLSIVDLWYGSKIFTALKKVWR